jgi:hypothetical protein
MIDVEPLIREELDRRVPPPAPQLASWDDVLGRAGERRHLPASPTRRAMIIAAAIVAVAGAAASAYAVGRHLLVGGPAPPDVKEQAVLLNQVKGELIPRVYPGPRIRVEQTRLAAALDASTGRVYLWVAPTERGDYCLFKQIVGTELPDGSPNLSGGCGRGDTPIDSTLSGTRVRDGGWLSLVYGHVDEAVQRLVVRVDGRTHQVPLSGRFFLFELPEVADGQFPEIELVAYDAQGNELARKKHAVPANFTRRPQPVDISGKRPLLEIETRRTKKPIRLYVIDRGGERCLVLVSPGGTGSGCGGRPPEPREIPIAPNQIGTAPDGMLLLWGEVGNEIERLELRFQDGRVERLPLVEHFTLYQIHPHDFVDGRRPIELVGRNAAGEVVGRRELGPWQS